MFDTYRYGFEPKDGSRLFKDSYDQGRKTDAQSSGVPLLETFANLRRGFSNLEHCPRNGTGTQTPTTEHLCSYMSTDNL
ncbi:hypothetical protein SAMN05216603_11049 [Pseudomonas benzenivorans]|nr:hypothetical protein [Pseudomonas benzenivorans]SDH54159.1 hypothetical protein SAMN05216603_11049 [Pseudomonas benzenivorans]